MDKLTALRVFRRVVELGSFAAAARDLDLSNAAISKNVRELESELGAALLNRTTRRLHLTEAGEAYLSRVRDVLDELAEADAAAAEHVGAPRGRLRVTAPMSIGITKIAPAIASFVAKYPEISIDIAFDDRQVDVVEGGYDLAVRGAGRLKDSDLAARKLGDLDRVVCASPDYIRRRGAPKKPADLSAHACLVYTLSASPDRWSFSRNGKVETVEIAGPLRMNNSLALAAAVAAGAGLALLPTFLVERQLRDRAVQPVLAGWKCEPSALYAVFPRHRQSSIKLRAFIEHLSGVFRATASSS